MSHQHLFIFHPGRWSGEGTVSFHSSPEEMFFATEWSIDPKNGEGISCRQKVKMEGVEQELKNDFYFYDLTDDRFSLTLTSPYLEKVIGTGLIDDQRIAWEFHQEGGGTLEGFEVYEIQDDGSYHIHAEYSTPDQFRTIINGRIKQVKME
ncbi:MAG: hypothetical protein WB791_08300 [Waddliaceae bacterium]